MAPEARDHYQVLGVPRTASAEEIQRSYRKLARRYHPDVNKDPSAEDLFKEISEAYHVLSDPDSRSRYDRFGPAWRQVPEDYEAAGAGFGGRPGARPGARAGAGARAAGGPWTQSGPRTQSGPWTQSGPRAQTWSSAGPGGVEVDFEDLFGDIFGERVGGFGRGPVGGADTEAELTLTVEDAYQGGRRGITLDGRGGPRRYEVNIPPGITDGQRIRLAGQGSGGMGGGPAGDLYLIVRLAPHPRYRVDGRDVTVDLPVTPWEAALGATVPVDTPGGPAQVDLPPGSSTGRRLRLRGRGMPNPRGTPGDLYAEVRIMVPPTPTPAERSLFEQLAKVSTVDPRSR